MAQVAAVSGSRGAETERAEPSLEAGAPAAEDRALGADMEAATSAGQGMVAATSSSAAPSSWKGCSAPPQWCHALRAEGGAGGSQIGTRMITVLPLYMTRLGKESSC